MWSDHAIVADRCGAEDTGERKGKIPSFFFPNCHDNDIKILNGTLSQTSSRPDFTCFLGIVPMILH